jgi:hypothetical protein
LPELAVATAHLCRLAKIAELLFFPNEYQIEDREGEVLPASLLG